MMVLALGLATSWLEETDAKTVLSSWALPADVLQSKVCLGCGVPLLPQDLLSWCWTFPRSSTQDVPRDWSPVAADPLQPHKNCALFPGPEYSMSQKCNIWCRKILDASVLWFDIWHLTTPATMISRTNSILVCLRRGVRDEWSDKKTSPLFFGTKSTPLSFRDILRLTQRLWWGQDQSQPDSGSQRLATSSFLLF